MSSLRQVEGSNLKGSIQLPEWLTAAILVILAFTFWKPDYSFFWLDDWEFLDRFRTFNLHYLFDQHHGHVIPLYKLTYLLQLRIFGTNTIYFAYVNIMCFALGNYVLFRLARSITNTTSAWVLAVLITVHPIMFKHLGWSFELCISLQLLFQFLAVGLFIQWTRTSERRYWMLAFGATVIQNYFFGNGLFFPLLFVAGATLIGPLKGGRPVATAFLVLFMVFIAVQMLLGEDLSRLPHSLGEVRGIAAGAIYLLGVNTSRAFLIQEHLLGWITPWLTIGLFVLLVMLALMNKARDRRMAIFHLVWFITTFCSIPLAHGERLITKVEIPYYYSILALAPLLFLVEHALAGRSTFRKIHRRLRFIAVGIILLATFLIAQQLKEIGSFRSFRNQQMMFKSLEEGTNYQPFDDPYFTEVPPIVHDPVEVYSYWRSRDLFRPRFGYSANPVNWTQEAITP